MSIVKKGRRHHLYRSKYAERRWQQRRKQTPLQIITNILENKDRTTLTSVNDNETTAISGLTIQAEQDQHSATTEAQGAIQTAAETSSSQEIQNIKWDHPCSQLIVQRQLSQSLSGWHLYSDNDPRAASASISESCNSSSTCICWRQQKTQTIPIALPLVHVRGVIMIHALCN